MKILLSIILTLTFLINISKCSQVIFIPQDCSSQCDFFNPSNWIGGKLPTYTSDVLIDYTYSTVKGPQNIIVSNSLFIGQLTIKSNVGINNVILNINQPAKIQSLSVYPNSGVTVGDGLAFLIDEDMYIGSGSSLTVNSKSIVVVDGKTTFDSNSTCSLYGSTLQAHSAYIDGIFFGDNSSNIQFESDSIISGTMTVASLNANSNLTIASGALIYVGLGLGGNGNITIEQNAFVTVVAILCERINVEGTLNIRGTNMYSTIVSMYSSPASIVTFSYGNYTTIRNTMLLGLTSIKNAPLYFQNGYIQNLDIMITSDMNPIDLLFDNVIVESTSPQSEIKYNLNMVCQSLCKFSKITEGNNVSLIAERSSILDLSGSSIQTDYLFSRIIGLSNSTVLLNSTRILGPYLYAESSTIVNYGESSLESFIDTESSKIVIYGSFTVKQFNLLNSTLTISDGILSLDDFLIAESSKIYLLLTQLSTSLDQAAIQAENEIDCRTSSLEVYSPKSQINAEVIYALMTTQINNILISYSNCTFAPSSPTMTAAFSNNSYDSTQYLGLKFTSSN